MKIRLIIFRFALLLLMSCDVSFVVAQNSKTRVAPKTETQTQQNAVNPNATLPANSTEILTSEIVSLRKSLQSLNSNLRKFNESVSGANSPTKNAANDKQILLSLEALTRAEERAGILRKQLIEMIEKENALKNRLVQIEEDIRPENIERNTNVVGTARASELREVNRRKLENERNSSKSLLEIVAQSRAQLEEDFRQADALVQRLRRKILPLIEKATEITNANPQ